MVKGGQRMGDRERWWSGHSVGDGRWEIERVVGDRENGRWSPWWWNDRLALERKIYDRVVDRRFSGSWALERELIPIALDMKNPIFHQKNDDKYHTSHDTIVWVMKIVIAWAMKKYHRLGDEKISPPVVRTIKIFYRPSTITGDISKSVSPIVRARNIFPAIVGARKIFVAHRLGDENISSPIAWWMKKISSSIARAMGDVKSLTVKICRAMGDKQNHLPLWGAK